MIIMGIDYGEARTGVAICGKSEMLASPVGTINEKDFNILAQKIADLVKEKKAEKLVVGLPLRTDGKPSEKAEKCRKFAELLKELTGLDVVMWDERCTTVSAHGILNETNVRGKKRKEVVDTVAAVLILEGYLSYRKKKAKENADKA